MNYKQLFIELYKSNIRYLICGGLATNIYGLHRMTADVDLILDLEESNLSNFKNIMSSLDLFKQS